MYSSNRKRTYSSMGSNSLIKGSTNSIAKFSSGKSEDGSLTVSHKEYICDVQGSTSETSFNLTNYLINPGNPTLFPWLSQIAQNYDEYMFYGLIFHFRSTCTDNSTSSAQLGTLIMAANYNSSAANFVNKQQMMEYAGAVSVKISNDLQFGIECNPQKRGGNAIEYIAPNGTAPINEDAKSYMLANLQLAVNSTQSSGQIGELWCTYKVKLCKPKYCVTNALCQPFVEAYNVAPFTTALGNNQSVPYLNTTAVQTLTGSPSTTGPFGYVSNISGGTSSPSGVFNYYTATKYGCGFRFPDTLGSGTYFVQFIFRGIDRTAPQLDNDLIEVLPSANVQTYQVVKVFEADTSTLIINFKLAITASAYSLAIASPNVITNNYTTTVNGTWFLIANGNVMQWNTNPSATLVIQQLNPAVKI